MPSVPLTLSTLGSLDRGAAELAVNKALTAMFADLDDRGGDLKKRSVTILVEAEPRPNGSVEVQVKVSAKVPGYETAGTVGQLRRGQHGPRLLFQPESPASPDQDSLPFHDPETGEIPND